MIASKSSMVPSVGRTLLCLVFASTVLFAFSSAMAEPTLPPDPVFGWAFDEGTGTTAYPEFGNQNGTLKSGTGWSSNSPFSHAGSFSLDFPTKTAHVALPTHASGATGSFQFWAYASDMGGGDYFVHSLGGEGGRIYLWVPTNNPALVGLGLDGVGVGTFSRPPNDMWNHFVIVWDESLATDNVKAYVTNSLGTNVYPLTKSIDSGITGEILMGSAGNALGFAGQLDDVAFWNVALTADDVAWLYQHSITEIPEPATATLAALAVVGLFFRPQRRNRIRSLR